MTTEAQQLVENLLNDEPGQPLPPSQPSDDILDPKGMANDIAAEEQAELDRLKSTGEVNPKTVKQYGYVYHRTAKRRDGTACAAKVTSIRTWKRDPNRWEIGWKYGMYEYGTITPQNASEWTTIEPPAVKPQKRR